MSLVHPAYHEIDRPDTNIPTKFTRSRLVVALHVVGPASSINWSRNSRDGSAFDQGHGSSWIQIAVYRRSHRLGEVCIRPLAIGFSPSKLTQRRYRIAPGGAIRQIAPTYSLAAVWRTPRLGAPSSGVGFDRSRAIGRMRAALTREPRGRRQSWRRGRLRMRSSRAKSAWRTSRRPRGRDGPTGTSSRRARLCPSGTAPRAS